MISSSGIEFRWLGRVPYDTALALQLDLAESRRAGHGGDTVLLLEHDPVYTIGRTPDKSSLGPLGHPALPHPVVEISRGGQATYHGPGQLVGYLILDLKNLGADLHRYLRAIEDALIAHAASLGLAAERRENLTGMWIGPRKLASIGVGVRHWISLHGFALNVTPESLTGFQSIVPCGLPGVEMTCLATECGQSLQIEDVADGIRPFLSEALAILRAPPGR